MEFRFSSAVRASLAAEFKRASWMSVAGVTLLNLSIGSGSLLLVSIAVWIVLQTLAHLLMALEDVVDADAQKED